MKLENRLVRSATYEKLADMNGYVTDGLVGFYEELAKGGVGLIISGNILVHKSGVSVPQMPWIVNDSYIEGLGRLVDSVHKLGGKIVAQLVHGGRQCYPELLEEGQAPVAPSSVFEPLVETMPRALEEDEIWEIIKAFADAARRVKAAGFDGVQIHGAHGYLVSEFLSPHTNRREDSWGGDEERRFRFVEEVLKAIREVVGNEYPVMIKMNCEDFVEGGLTVDESVRVAKRLEEASIDAVEISGAMYESKLPPARKKVLCLEDEAYFRPFVRKYKDLLKVPVMLVGGMRTKALCEEILNNKDADFISISRPLIREPDLPIKFKSGKERADCISCNGCMRFKKLDFVKCTQLGK